MIYEYERYHGVVVRQIIVESRAPISIEAHDVLGRVNSYLLNGVLAIHIKHSSKRLPPWTFTFSTENIVEIFRLATDTPSMWLALVCGGDGVVAISWAEFDSITKDEGRNARFVTVDRDRNTMYRVRGNASRVPLVRPRGVAGVLMDTRLEGRVSC